MIERKQNTKTINFLFCFLLIIDSLCVLFPFDHLVFLFCFLLVIDSLFVLFPFDHLVFLFCFLSDWVTWTLLKTGMNTCGWHRRMDTSCSTSHACCDTVQKDYQWLQYHSHSRIITWFVTRVTQGAWLVEQEVYILLCHPPVFIPVFRRVYATQALVSSVVLCESGD
jgi:hypothetical protein